MLRQILRPTLLPHWWQDALLLLPRLVCGYLLAFDFGASKFGMPWSPPDNNLGLFEVAFWFPNDVAAYGGVFALLPAFFAWMGAFSEAVGGLLLLAGLGTRVSGFLISCTMLVAIFLQQLPNGIWNALPAASFLWVSLMALVLGSGRFGLDYLLTRRATADVPARLRPLAALALLVLLLPGCVQPTADKTVVYLLDVHGHGPVRKVGLRGRDKPLNWDQDLQLTPVVPDSLYRAVVTTRTGYRITEVKFTLNDTMELSGADNRRIEFGAGDTVTYRGQFGRLVAEQ